MSAGLIAAAAAPVVGGLIGQYASRGDKKASEEALKKILAEYGNVPLPELDRIGTVDLESYDGISGYTPEMMQNVDQQASAMESISTDPALRRKQMEALAKLADIGDDGFTAEDKAALSSMQGALNREERGSREAILQNMRARGASGSGLELMAQLNNQQASSEIASQQGMQINADARRRALEAIMQQGQLSGQMRSQDFGEQADKARAADAINAFNTAGRRDVQAGNVAAANQGQMTNIQLAQQGVDRRNQNRMVNQVEIPGMNNQIANQGFSNQMQRASGVASGHQALGGHYGQQAQNTQAMWGGIGQGVGQGTAAYYGAQQGAKK